MIVRLQIVAAAVLFSTGGAVIKASTLSPWHLAGLRAAIGGLTLMAVLPAARKVRDWRVVGVAGLYAVMTVSYVVATKLTTAGNVMFLIAASPLIVLAVSWWWLGEGAGKRDLYFLAPMAVGLLLCLAPGQSAQATAPDPGAGNLFAVVNSVIWAVLLVAMRALGRGRSRQEDLAPAAIACGNLLAAVACLAVAGLPSAARPLDWGIVAYLGLFQIGLAYVLLTAAVREVPSFEGSLLLLAEPVLNPLFAWLVHGELPAPWSRWGGAVILLSLAAKLWWVDRRRSLAPDVSG